jgi:hypothetical protein
MTKGRKKVGDLSGRYKLLVRKHLEFHQWIEIDTKDIIISQQDLSKLPCVEDSWKKVFEDLSVGEVKKVKKKLKDTTLSPEEIIEEDL